MAKELQGRSNAAAAMHVAWIPGANYSNILKNVRIDCIGKTSHIVGPWTRESVVDSHNIGGGHFADDVFGRPSAEKPVVEELREIPARN